MPGTYNPGAVYNWNIHRLMDKSTDDLIAILDGWTKKSFCQKILAHLNPFVDWELKIKAAEDLITARENSNGEIAKNINPKIAGWHAERGETVAA